jgi:hypothetical protein
MGSLMNLQTTRTRIALATVVTNEWFMSRMDELMSFEVPFSDELLGATFKTAYKWSFASLL